MKAINEDKLERNKLKLFLESFLPDFYVMKKVGFFKKDLRKTDYEKIAERYCKHFGLDSIFDYRLVCHGSACDGKYCDRSNPHCPSHPKGKWNSIKWENYKLNINEKDLNFDETITN